MDWEVSGYSSGWKRVGKVVPHQRPQLAVVTRQQLLGRRVVCVRGMSLIFTTGMTVRLCEKHICPRQVQEDEG